MHAWAVVDLGLVRAMLSGAEWSGPEHGIKGHVQAAVMGSQYQLLYLVMARTRVGLTGTLVLHLEAQKHDGAEAGHDCMDQTASFCSLLAAGLNYSLTP